MNLKIGIVGLPNVGKSTLFNALIGDTQAQAENFPFCTIDPNVGIVNVPDNRLQEIAKIINPKKIVNSVVEFVDIAGLVAGASKGEGLGNKFLANIRECQIVCHVLRDFENADIHHVDGRINPKDDFETICTELALADLESCKKQMERVNKKARTGDKNEKKRAELLQKIREILEQNKLIINEIEQFSADEKVMLKEFFFLTAKKYLIAANISEDALSNFDIIKFREKIGVNSLVPIIPVSAKTESELCQLEEDEKKEFLQTLGVEYSGLENLIRASFDLLNLQSYFTAGVQEVRAWTIPKGSTAPQAAGEIHTDFERGFIKADTIAYKDFIEFNGEAGAKEKGKLRVEGKDYIVQDGDVMHFKFNV